MKFRYDLCQISREAWTLDAFKAKYGHQILEVRTRVGGGGLEEDPMSLSKLFAFVFKSHLRTTFGFCVAGAGWIAPVSTVHPVL